MNLSETQSTIKKVIILLIAFTAFYYTAKFSYLGVKSVYFALFPPQAAEPASEFGILPRLKMQSVTIKGTPKYNLDTIDGNLPQFPDRLNVYKIIKPEPTLLSERNIKQLASDMYFTDQYTKKSSSEFVWVDGTYNRSMVANAVTENFTLRTQLVPLGTALSAVPTIKEDDAIAMVSNFIKSKSLLNDIDSKSIKYTSIPSKIVLGSLKEETLNPNQSKIIKIDANRYINIYEKHRRSEKLVKSFPILGPNPKNSLISFFVTNHKDVYKFPIISYTYWKYDQENPSDYYLSDISSVWQTITEGNGVIAYIKPSKNDYYDYINNVDVSNIDIRNVYLAYYEPSEYSEDTQYLQPIYVFEGKFSQPDMQPNDELGDIIIYYPAIRGDWVK